MEELVDRILSKAFYAMRDGMDGFGITADEYISWCRYNDIMKKGIYKDTKETRPHVLINGMKAYFI